MKYSYTWLQEHLAQPLPGVEELARTITIKAFEVEGMEKFAATNDTVLDIKVLPDRAHDALAHRGMAREIAALFGSKRKEREMKTHERDEQVAAVRVEVEEKELCPRYIGVRVDGVEIGPSPEWLQTKLASIGQRSINSIVDLTNFILFDLGQPMHAFDADKVVGGITVRLAKAGETMTTLDTKALTFDGTELVIADDEGVLALAGVKGGKKAEVDSNTTAIIFECANFDATATRKTSTKHNIKTDASKRYENGMTSELAGEAIMLALTELHNILPAAKIGALTDVYSKPENEKQHISITIREINHLLGTVIGKEEMTDVLQRLAFEYKKDAGATEIEETYTVVVPVERLDLRIKEDLIEEIGRHYGYDKITSTLPQLEKKGLPNKRLYYANKVRNFLIERGFSEVYTYAFAVPGEGDVEVINSVGKDRPFMRRSLVSGIERALLANFYNAPFLEIADIKIFELGNIFEQKGEHCSLALGAMGGTKKRWKALEGEFLKTYDEMLVGLLHGQKAIVPMPNEQLGVIEIDFDTLIASLPEAESCEDIASQQQEIIYRSLSTYPFIVRDIALWVPKETIAEEIEAIIRANAGELAQKIYLFDTFEKDDKKSFAFRMVLQSFDRTLTDDEANAAYDRVVDALRTANSGWEVRA